MRLLALTLELVGGLCVAYFGRCTKEHTPASSPIGRAGILVHFSKSIPVYSLRERYISHHLWMMRPNKSDALLYGRFGSIPFWPALPIGAQSSLQ
jgi:hypothetical protein